MTNILELLSPDRARSVTIYFFLAFIFLALVVFFIVSLLRAVERVTLPLLSKKYDPHASDGEDERILQKIVGGFGVFVVAILSNNAWVMSLSLFIGGLIIASERFMRALAIIMKTESKDLPNALTALSTLETRNATKKEFDEKIEQEVKETLPASPIPDKGAQLTERRKRLEKLRMMGEKTEIAVNQFFNAYFGDRYRPQIKITNQYGSVVADGALYDEADTSKMTNLAEIKYFDTDRDNEFLQSEIRFAARRTIERFRYFFIPESIMLAIVGETFTKEHAVLLGHGLEKDFNNAIWPAIFNIKSDGNIEPLYPEALEDFFKTPSKKNEIDPSST